MERGSVELRGPTFVRLEKGSGRGGGRGRVVGEGGGGGERGHSDQPF